MASTTSASHVLSGITASAPPVRHVAEELKQPHRGIVQSVAPPAIVEQEAPNSAWYAAPHRDWAPRSDSPSRRLDRYCSPTKFVDQHPQALAARPCSRA